MGASLFFFASKIIWSLLMPCNFLIFLLFAGIILSSFHAKIARGIIVFSGTALFLIAAFPIGNIMMRQLEQIYPAPTLPQNIDGIIVLGGFLEADKTFHYGQPVLNEAAERLTMFFELSKKYPNAKLIMSGGSSNLIKEAEREADGVAKVWQNMGGDSRRLVLERDSHNTRENFANSMRIAGTKSGENWIIITSAFHMKRAMNCFEQSGWDVTPIPYPVDYRADLDDRLIPLHFATNLEKFDIAIKEWFGLWVNQLTIQ